MMGLENFKLSSRQYSFLGMGILIMLVLLYGLCFGIDVVKNDSNEAKTVDTNIENAETQLPMQSLWNAKMELERKEMTKTIADLEQKLADGQQKQKENQSKQILELESKIKNASNGKSNEINDAIMKKLQTLEAGVSSLEQIKLASNKKGVQESNAPYSPVISYDNEEELSTVEFNLDDDNHNTPDNTIPAGSFVKAILLSGVEASTATQSSGNPRPIVLELIDHASLPNAFRASVKNCRLIGAATGDISSERVEIRLESMSCIESDTMKITQGTMSGFVSGEDGRAGLRGRVVIKDRELMMNSLIGGMLGGASQAVSQLANPVSSFNPMTGDVSKTQNSMDLLKQAGGQGASGALDRYAKYHIERAESLQPVIQVSSNRIVDVVFTASFNFAAPKESLPLDFKNNNKQQSITSKQHTSLANKQAKNQSKDFASDYLGGY